MRLLFVALMLFATPAFACQEHHVCNDHIICDEKSVTMTRSQFNEWLKTPASKNGYTVEWASSSNAWVIYNENCTLKELCFDSLGSCVNG